MAGFSDPNSLSNLQRRQAQLIAQLNAPHAGGVLDDPNYMAARDELQSLNGRIGSMSGGPQAGGPADQMAKDRQRITDLTEGRIDTIMNDPVSTAALDRLKAVMSGSATPYNQEVRSNMLTAAADQNASAESAQAGMLRDQVAANGGNMADPASGAALRELMSKRQQANQGAANGIAQTANIANFNAQQDATRDSASIRSGQLGQANSMALAGADYRARDKVQLDSPQPAPMPAFMIPPMQQQPMYSGMGPNGGGSPAPQPPPSPAPQPIRSTVGGAVQVNAGNPATADRTYDSTGMNTVTGVQRGTGYAQMSGQPETRQYVTPSVGTKPATQPAAPSYPTPAQMQALIAGPMSNFMTWNGGKPAPLNLTQPGTYRLPY